MAAKSEDNTWRQETLAIHAGGLQSPVFGEVSPPIFQTSTFAFPSAEAGAARFSGEQPGYLYTRINNPTVNALEAARGRPGKRVLGRGRGHRHGRGQRRPLQPLEPG